MGGSVVAAATIPDALTFAVAAVICVAGAFGVVLMRNPVHAALSLVMTLFGVAVLFVEEDAQFLAAVQVIVYTGAIVVLFLFVIMLLGVDRKEQVLADVFRGQRVVALLLGCMVLAEVLLLARSRWTTGAHAVAGSLGSPGANVAKLGRSIFTTYLVPFEATSALLVVAVIGAVVLARRPSDRPVEEIPPVDEVERRSPLAPDRGAGEGAADPGSATAASAARDQDVHEEVGSQ